MANLIWSMGNMGCEAITCSEKARLVECDPHALYESGLELMLRGLQRHPAPDTA